MSDEHKAKCPECNHEFSVSLGAIVPDEQRLSVTLESTTNMFAAESIGQTIVSTTKLLEEVAKGLGEKVCVFIEAIILDGGKCRIDLLIANIDRSERS